MNTWIKIAGIAAAAGLLTTAAIGSNMKSGASTKPDAALAAGKTLSAEGTGDDSKTVAWGGTGTNGPTLDGLDDAKTVSWGGTGSNGPSLDGLSR